MFGGIGVQELLLILLIILILFGAKKIPEVARGLGKSVSEFKKGVREIEDEVKSEGDKEKKNLAG